MGHTHFCLCWKIKKELLSYSALETIIKTAVSWVFKKNGHKNHIFGFALYISQTGGVNNTHTHTPTHTHTHTEERN